MKSLIVSLSLLCLCALPVNAGSLSFSPSSATLSVNQTTQISLSLNTQGQAIIGVDVILDYDSRHLEIANVTKTAAFPQISRLVSHPNSLAFALYHHNGSSFQGTGDIATLTLKPREPGTHQLSFRYQPLSTTDTNIVSTKGTDALDTVNQFTLTATPTSSPSSSPSPSPSPIISPSPSPLPSSFPPSTPLPSTLMSTPTPSPQILGVTTLTTPPATHSAFPALLTPFSPPSKTSFPYLYLLIGLIPLLLFLLKFKSWFKFF